jgi:MipA family protein
MIKPIKTFIFCLLTLTAYPAWPDALTNLTDAYTVDGVPVQMERATSGFHGALGAWLLNYQKDLGDSLRKTSLLPLALITYQDWAYFGLGGAGVWLAQAEDHSVKFGVGIKGHRGYDPTNQLANTASGERRNSIDGGIIFVWRTDIVNVGANYSTDLGNASNGSSASLRFSHVFRVSQKLSLIPRVNAEWLDARVVDYYFGVPVSEATVSLPPYSGHSTVNWGAGLNAGYRLSPQWRLLGGLNYTRFGSGIVDSPLVLNNHSTTVYLGAAWLF